MVSTNGRRLRFLAPLLSLLSLTSVCRGQNLPLDTSGVKPGPIAVESTAGSATIHWQDEDSKPWQAVFSLDPRQPLISSISVAGKEVIQRAQPFYRCETGKRRGGWDAFFDFPPGAPGGTRSFL